jgi:oligoribonuclease NrnB/cAMP/cGMP phosphodiesterase (DHH superfamily)
MMKKIAVDMNDEASEFTAYGAVRPVRLRKVKKRAVRARKARRKVCSPGGIHRRANKRMTW